MKRLIAPMAGALIGGALAVILGSASAIREANDRAHQAREVAGATMANYDVAMATIAKQRTELDRLNGI
jgi:hypothetical protein